MSIYFRIFGLRLIESILSLRTIIALNFPPKLRSLTLANFNLLPKNLISCKQSLVFCSKSCIFDFFVVPLQKI